MGLLHRGRAFLNRALPAAAGEALTYARGGTTVALTAADAWPTTPAPVQLQPGQQATATAAPGEMDFVIVADALGLEPRKGDRITRTVGVASEVYQVTDRPDRPAWDWGGDAGHTRYRVHTIRVS